MSNNKLVLLVLFNCFLFAQSDNRRRFVDKVVIITGSSSGIGRDAAIEFAKEGASVVIHGRDKKRLKETESMIIEKAKVSKEKVLKVYGDIEKVETTKAIFDETIKKFNKIDILINNAGTVMLKGTKEQFDLNNLDYLYNVGLRSIVHLTSLCLPKLVEQKGVILNVSSLASIRPVALAPFYSATKAALDQWTRTLALIYGAQKVRVNSINPGPIDNTLLDRDLNDGLPSDEQLASKTVLHRLGTVHDISNAMKFLCSDEASFITGEILVVDGGMALH
ncbi:hypothetical protein niasHT_025811 [Heterodera trifolii]|uniref:Uncharacterized protein n=1 Tax=Heterodera trifolii TaxID=157864 RepID=A0ABD2KST8_9BILA